MDRFDSLSCPIVDLEKILTSLNLLKLLSQDATLTGSVRKAQRAFLCLDKHQVKNIYGSV